MSKHSIRTGIASRPRACASPSSASVRRSRRRWAASWSSSRARPALRSGELEDPLLLAPLGRPDLDRAAPADGERFGEDGADRALDDDLGGDRDAGLVVLEEELLEHLVERPLGLVGQVEGLAIGEGAVADLEDLGVGLGARRRRSRRRRACRPTRWRPAGARAGTRPPAGGCARRRPARTPGRPTRPACGRGSPGRGPCSGRRGSRSPGRSPRGTRRGRRSRRRARRTA